ncbi:hypothetical protein PUN28_013945 [Cardiocondyla obscurior]|uniref:Uncharacterized protein n=1 Tax=Cardiocondyla obscurior TaxID=286306 RepID=A0AAW2F7E2_9HYME
MAKKTKKNIFEIWQHSIIWPKNKKLFLKFYNVALCGIQKKCIQAYSKHSIFTSSRVMAEKRKKLFLKFYNVALYAYGPVPNLLFSPADEIWPRNKKNFFENWQHNIVRK